MAHHRFVKPEVVESIYKRLTNKDEFIAKLVEMYNDPIATLLDEPEQENGEGNLDWKAGW